MSTDSAVTRDAAAGVRPFPVAPAGTMGPPEEYRRLRRECPVARVQVIGEVPGLDTTGWFVTRYADVRALLADKRLIRPDVNDWPQTPPDWPPVVPDMVTLMEMEGPRHDTLRKAVADAFSARSVRDRAVGMRATADELLDKLVAGGQPADLVAGFTEPFPVRVMCDLTGVPFDTRDRFVPIAKHLLFSVDLDDDDEGITGEVRDLVVEWIERKRRQSDDDVLTDLIRRWEGGELSEEDVISFGRSMIIAGFLPSTMILANAILTLLTHPDQLAALRADPRLLPAAVEELLRYAPVLNGNVFLIATEDISLQDQTIRAGELVIPVLAAANRDESVFADADRFDIHREHNPHLAFGRGTHNCLGAHLTRTTFAVALEALLERFPGLGLAVDGHAVPWPDPRRKFKSPLALPVTW